MSALGNSRAPVATPPAPEKELSPTPILWHLKVSHYNEKARWALDYKGIRHVRRARLPGTQTKIAQRLSGGDTFPVLKLDGQAIGDSTEIIAALERRRPQPPLYPADPDERRHALLIEDFFDEELGPYERLLVVNSLFPNPNVFLGVFAPDLDGLRRVSARAVYPLIRRHTCRTLDINRATVERAWTKCRVAGERFQAEIQPNGYLVGDSFSIADLTVAALVAPAVAPVQFPYPQPQRGHALLADLRGLLDEYGLGDWTREIYARHRGASAEIGG